ncbi:hypothetical protein CONLIGDRAFT_686945 [Coniochaeta ligniaria NRRL 30616]|uniref:Uncharacterized protein n=1 Tax=Coniochaeta ligniaria NRRL 30616 TaxID=1408157 RepID=A0A1J7J202_9PEZI|nr:hypothetical protein CONLIGDRAFT_686945 [Coniochaeta ligniaria NRRL 30616]
MDVSHDVSLPPLPLLKGVDNLKVWQAAIVQTFRYYGIADYLFKDSTEMLDAGLATARTQSTGDVWGCFVNGLEASTVTLQRLEVQGGEGHEGT